MTTAYGTLTHFDIGTGWSCEFGSFDDAVTALWDKRLEGYESVVFRFDLDGDTRLAVDVTEDAYERVRDICHYRYEETPEWARQSAFCLSCNRTERLCSCETEAA